MRSKTSWGTWRIARYRNKANGWYMDIDCQWSVAEDRDPKRYRVFYGPSVVLPFATRQDAFRWVRAYLAVPHEKFEPSPY